MVRTRVGYSGGTTDSPTYRSLGDHSETLQIDYDPTVVSYEALLNLFWLSHDPAQRPWSRQYMAAVFYHGEAQRRIAHETKAREEARIGRDVGTVVAPLDRFFRAEDYHQKYSLQHDLEIMNEFRRMYPAFRDIVDSTAAARINGILGGYGKLSQIDKEIDRYGLTDRSRQRLLAHLMAMRQ